MSNLLGRVRGLWLALAVALVVGLANVGSVGAQAPTPVAIESEELIGGFANGIASGFNSNIPIIIGVFTGIFVVMMMWALAAKKLKAK